MKAKSALFAVLMVLSLIVCLVASPGHSYAGTPEGTVCFEDSRGGLWFLDFGNFSSGLNFDIHGFLARDVSCNSTFVEPVSGTATFDVVNNTIVFGLSSIASGTGTDCEPIFWHVVFDKSSLESFPGSFVTQSGSKGSFVLTVMDCSSVLTAAGKKSQNLKGFSQR